MDQHKRPSVYLQERCAELGRVLDFFLVVHRGQMPGIDERLVVFLAQLGFWEWELDNLVFAFTTFAERARAWESDNGHALAEGLKARGLPVRFAAVKNVKGKRLARAERVRQVVAPVAELNRVIAMWNALLALCEERVLLPAEERAELAALGAGVLPDLSKYRRAPLPVPADE
jgi:hypothetical protein